MLLGRPAASRPAPAPPLPRAGGADLRLANRRAGRGGVQPIRVRAGGLGPMLGEGLRRPGPAALGLAPARGPRLGKGRALSSAPLPAARCEGPAGASGLRLLICACRSPELLLSPALAASLRCPNHGGFWRTLSPHPWSKREK